MTDNTPRDWTAGVKAEVLDAIDSKVYCASCQTSHTPTAVETGLNSADVARIFQALCTEVHRLESLPRKWRSDAATAHAISLRDQFALLIPECEIEFAPVEAKLL